MLARLNLSFGVVILHIPKVPRPHHEILETIQVDVQTEVYETRVGTDNQTYKAQYSLNRPGKLDDIEASASRVETPSSSSGFENIDEKLEPEVDIDKTASQVALPAPAKELRFSEP